MAVYHALSKNKRAGLRLQHDTLRELIAGHYPGAVYQEGADYPRGYTARHSVSDAVWVECTLNKTDKELGAWAGKEDRVKVDGLSKNGYLITFVGHSPPAALLHQLRATRVR